MVSWASVKLVLPRTFAVPYYLKHNGDPNYILPFSLGGIRAFITSSSYLFCVTVSRWKRQQQWTVATAVVGGGSSDRRQQWAVATAAGVDVHGGDSSGLCYLGDSSGDCSRGANTNTLHLTHLNFYTQAFVIHTRAHVPMFQPTCRNSLTAQHGCYVSTMHVERTGLTGTSTESSCPG